MGRLINIELQKLLNLKIARIFLITYAVLLILSAVVLSQNISFLGITINLGDMGVFDFPNVWHVVAFFASLGMLFLAVIIMTSMSNEYSYGTIKQNLIDGLTKKEFLSSKYLVMILISLASTVLVFLIALVLGLIFTEEGHSMLDDFQFIPAYFLNHITFFSFCIFVCVLIRRSALSIALVIIWFIVEGIISGIESGIKYLLDNNLDFTYSFTLTDYLPLTSMMQLMPWPIKRFAAIDQATMGQIKEIVIPTEIYIICIFYFFLFMFLSYKLIKRRDL